MSEPYPEYPRAAAGFIPDGMRSPLRNPKTLTGRQTINEAQGNFDTPHSALLNPEGWQMVAGVSFQGRGEKRPPENASPFRSHPGGVLEETQLPK